MDSIDNRSLDKLSDDEITRLVAIVIEEHGPDLTRIRFNDVMLGLFEHIAGLETISWSRASRYLKTLFHPRPCGARIFQQARSSQARHFSLYSAFNSIDRIPSP